MPPQGYMQRVDAPGATAGLVLGILSLVFSGPLVGLILAWIGFIKSRDAKTLCEADPTRYGNAGIAQAGYVCSIIGLCLGALTTCCMCGYFIIVALAISGGAASGF
ncbi:MAG: hypothetical protein JSV91_04980 [Phycisphaerales bacterium]|nr:MAG: hypothetical protein JSV91_04980 [Phycisphaerales bacterium]